MNVYEETRKAAAQIRQGVDDCWLSEEQREALDALAVDYVKRLTNEA